MKIRILTPRRGLFLKAIPRRDVDLTPHDRLNALFFCRLVKLNRPIQISMVGQSQRRLPQLLRPGRQLRHPTGPIQQGVL